MGRMKSFQDPRIDKDCPDYIVFQCPICGLITGKSGYHPPAKGVWINGQTTAAPEEGSAAELVLGAS